jgi:hypothetical protein
MLLKKIYHFVARIPQRPFSACPYVQFKSEEITDIPIYNQGSDSELFGSKWNRNRPTADVAFRFAYFINKLSSFLQFPSKWHADEHAKHYKRSIKIVMQNNQKSNKIVMSNNQRATK